ncbi:MAG: HYR domain-containing protein, partial [Bacteroidota bacterium]
MRHKNILWLIALGLSVSNLFAQNTAQVTAIQYYFNTDPGVGIAGNGAIVPVSPIGSINQTFIIPLPVLSNGLQNLYVRAKDEFDRWGMAERKLFYITTFEANNIISYQYYFDTDPGVGLAGNGAIVPVTSTTNYNQTVSIVVPNTLSAGFHNLYVRTQNDLGRWSITERRIFFITTYEANNIVNYQYYFDTDPGVGVVGNGAITAVTSTTNLTQTFNATVPNALSEGIHNFYVRVQNDLGRWSITERRLFFVSIYEANNINAYQYYFDTDPGVGIAGNGAIVAVSSTTNLTQNASIVLPNTLSSGIHNLYVRTRNDLGRWSITERRLFYIENNVTENISGLEYYFDTDPGVGNGTQIPITTTASINQGFAIYLPCTTPGIHKLYVRVKDSFGRWSIVERGSFTALSGVTASVITAAGPTTFCQGGSVALSTSPAVTGITYQWMQNGSPVSGETSIATTVTTSGSYTLQATCNGNSIESTPIVVIVNAPAVINTCPSPITQCDNHVVTWTNPTATGLPAPAVLCTPVSGSTFATGTTNVTCSATNSCGNSSCSFNVTINESPV